MSALSLHPVVVGPNKKEAFGIACGHFFLTTLGATDGLDIELAMHGDVEDGKEVIGHVRAVEPVIDSDEQLVVLLGQHDVKPNLTGHVVSPLHIVVWQRVVVPIIEGDHYRLSRFLWLAAIAW